MPFATWVDGVPASSIPVDDRGLAYGDGLFETVRVIQGRAPLLDLHLARLADGARRLAIGLDIAQLQAETAAFVVAQESGDFTLKILVTRGSAGRGYRADPAAVPRRALLGFPAADWPASHAGEGVALFECRLRLAAQPALAGIKHLNRLEQVLARSEWSEARYAEGLLCDEAGRAVECTMSNLFAVKDGCLLTPRLDRCGVRGVMRRWILDRAAALSLAAQEQDLLRGTLDGMDELFVCNSSFGIWPVRELGTRRWVPGPVTRRLQGEVGALWRAPAC